MTLKSIDEIRQDKQMRDTFDIVHDAAFSALCGVMFAIPVTAVILIVLVAAPAVVISELQMLALVGITIWGLLAVFLAAVMGTQR